MKNDTIDSAMKRDLDSENSIFATHQHMALSKLRKETLETDLKGHKNPHYNNEIFLAPVWSRQPG
jgi:hypothetical protein